MRPTYSAVVSTLALVVALGGTSYAAVKIDGGDIVDGSITSKDIKNKSIGEKDLAKDVADGQTGPAGPAGPVGPVGPAGPGQATPITFSMPAVMGSGPATVAQLGGLTILAGCIPDSSPPPIQRSAVLMLTSTSAGQLDRWQQVYGDAAAAFGDPSTTTSPAGQAAALVGSGYQGAHALSHFVWKDAAGVASGIVRSTYDLAAGTCHFAGWILHE